MSLAEGTQAAGANSWYLSICERALFEHTAQMDLSAQDLVVMWTKRGINSTSDDARRRSGLPAITKPGSS
jgi:hypothetical protein